MHWFFCFQSVIKCVGFIVRFTCVLSSLVLLSMVTHVMAFSIYLLREQMI